jgi:hypothetical protein
LLSRRKAAALVRSGSSSNDQGIQAALFLMLAVCLQVAAQGNAYNLAVENDAKGRPLRFSLRRRSICPSVAGKTLRVFVDCRVLTSYLQP